MTLPERFDLDSVPQAALAAHPAWLIAYDEEGEPGQDEATIKPNDLEDPALPGYVTAEVRFADGTTSLALLGGDFGVATLDDLDLLRLYCKGRMWVFTLGPDACEQEWPRESFYQAHPRLLPMSLTARMSSAFGGDYEDYGFTVDRDGGMSPLPKH